MTAQIINKEAHNGKPFEVTPSDRLISESKNRPDMYGTKPFATEDTTPRVEIIITSFLKFFRCLQIPRIPFLRFDSFCIQPV